MKNNGMRGIHRMLLILCGMALFLVNYFPIWRIELDAPQYPEGLELLIFSKGLAGDVAIINGLNHYIGMKTLHTEDFMEFTVLPYLIVFFALAFIAAGAWGKRAGGYSVVALFIVFGVLAMVDFWKWEYDYGHNLDPAAAIKVPGMAYQPPLIGFKQLLNFGAFSIPASGGWIFIAAGVIAVACMGYEWWDNRKEVKPAGVLRSVLFLAAAGGSLLLFQSCGAGGPEAIRIGMDDCAHCKMTISDKRFGCELVTRKGRAYKFDDVSCMAAFPGEQTVRRKEVKEFYLPDFAGDGELTPVREMLLLQSEALRSPMGGNTAAFKLQADLENALAEFSGATVLWDDLYKDNPETRHGHPHE